MSTPAPLKVGVVGIGRGKSFMEQSTPLIGMELVAICDTWAEKLTGFGERYPHVATYTDYTEFLGHDMDAVILANYFHEHAPFAIQALRAGKHVMSEVQACLTPADGVALIEAVEQSGLTYMLAENYPYMVYNQEMRRRYRNGDIGTFLYGEGEYVHPIEKFEFNGLSMGVDHWRNWLPVTYYCSHGLAPLMFITDTRPRKVSGFVIAHDPDDPNKSGTARRTDTASVIMAQMDNGAYVKLLQYDLRGHGNFVRVHGNRGLMENARTGDTNYVRVHREWFDKDPGEPGEMVYLPDFPEHHAEASRTAHGGGDFFTTYSFAQAIRTGTPPFFDVYRGVEMALTGILAYRSALNGSGLIDLPDLRDVRARAVFADDRWTPDPQARRNGAPGPAPSILGEIDVPAESLAAAEKDWSTFRSDVGVLADRLRQV